MAAQYRAPSPDALRIEPLDALTAIYDRASGRTHLVAPPVPEILAILADGAMGAAGLLSRLTQRYDLPDADPDVLLSRLDELIAVGLVERT